MLTRETAINFSLVTTRANRLTESVLRETVRQHLAWDLHYNLCLAGQALKTVVAPWGKTKPQR